MDPAACCPPILRSPLTDDDAAEAAAGLKAIADPTRLRLLNLLAMHGETCVCDFTEPIGLSQPTISHHLKVLHEVGLVDRDKRGTWVYYRLNAEAIEQLRDALRLPATLPTA